LSRNEPKSSSGGRKQTGGARDEVELPDSPPGDQPFLVGLDEPSSSRPGEVVAIEIQVEQDGSVLLRYLRRIGALRDALLTVPENLMKIVIIRVNRDQRRVAVLKDADHVARGEVGVALL